MKSDALRKILFDTMEKMLVNPYGLTIYRTKRGLSVAFISAFGESVKECFRYDEEIDVLYNKASDLCLKFRRIDKPFA